MGGGEGGGGRGGVGRIIFDSDGGGNGAMMRNVWEHD